LPFRSAGPPLQPVGQDVGGDPLLGACQQLPEVAAMAEHHVPQHEQAPAVTERLDRGVDRATRPRWLRQLAPHPRTGCNLLSDGLAWTYRLQFASRSQEATDERHKAADRGREAALSLRDVPGRLSAVNVRYR